MENKGQDSSSGRSCLSRLGGVVEDQAVYAGKQHELVEYLGWESRYGPKESMWD